jgi:hypothetical protein
VETQATKVLKALLAGRKSDTQRVKDMKKPMTFTNAVAITDEWLAVCSMADEMDANERFTRLFQYVEEDKSDWWYDDQDWKSRSLCYFGPAHEDFDDFVVLSEEGDVRYFTKKAPILEKIPGAGVYSEDAQGWGYLSDIQQIGDYLYACGFCGQVYKRFGPNDWRHVDSGLLQAADTPQNEAFGLSAINGPHEKAIYAVGYRYTEWYPPCAFFFDGKNWRELELPEVAERLTNIYVENEECIWLCGSNGTLLVGNAHQGFKSLSTTEDNQLFLSLCLFKGKIYLGSNMGLFVYDPAKPKEGINQVRTKLLPELQDANIVDCAGEVLWSIGPKDIARFDGKNWTRIHHPDNPRIG